MPPIAPEYKETEPTNLFGLSSFKDVYINKKNKVKNSEKNSICKEYPLSLSQMEIANNADIIGGQIDMTCLMKNDLLIYVAFNDSHNCEKQSEFLCL